MTDVVLAIVGSRHFAEPSKARREASEMMRKAITHFNPKQIISGGCPVGVDSWAENLARSLGYDPLVILPELEQWEPRGYKARNLKVGESCTHLLCIISRASKTYGAGWTADQAEKKGKKVYRRHI